MTEPFSILILGNVEECRTEAEVYIEGRQANREPWAVVYETQAGWGVDFLTEVTVEPSKEVAETALAAAQEALSAYVNRRGENPPPGLSAAGLSLWLMEKGDGTALGKRLD
jgi:hypothetical protein